MARKEKTLLLAESNKCTVLFILKINAVLPHTYGIMNSMHKLDIRLQTIADTVKETEVIADIGSDHGYLPIYLLKNGTVQKAILTDLNEGPLQNARKTAAKYRVENLCEFLRGDGLNPLKGKKADVISFCGMGGELIASMLEKNMDIAQSAQQLIFQPMNNKELLMKRILSYGFSLDSVKAVKDKNHFYFIISVSFGGADITLSDTDLEFSKELISQKDPVMKEFLLYRLHAERKVAENALAGNSMEEYNKRKKKIEEIEERIKSYES